MNMIKADFEREKKKYRRSLQKRLKRIGKGIDEKEKALQEARNWQSVEHAGNLLKTYFFKLTPKMSAITVEDFANDNQLVTIALDPKLEPKDQLKIYYQKSKKQKKSLPFLEKAIEHLKSEKLLHESVLSALILCETPEKLKSFQQELSRRVQSNIKKEGSKKVKSTPVHVFHTASGHVILVGKSAQANDELTFQMAKGDDLWLHISALPGSHIVIRKKQNAQIDEESLLDAVHLAIYFSKARHLQGAWEVTVTVRKYVFRIKGAPKGKVSLSKCKNIKVILDPARVAEIKERKGQ